MDSALFLAIADRFGHKPHRVLQMLRQVQAQLSYVPEQAIRFFADHLQLPLSQVRGCVEFYSFLHLTPRGQFDIYFSDSVTDRMAGSLQLAEMLASELGVLLGEPRADGRVTVSLTSCTGHCEQGPAGLVNGRVFTWMSTERVHKMAALVEAGTPVEQWPAEWFAVSDSIRVRNISLDTRVPLGDAIRNFLARGPVETLNEIEASGLQGRGGAGFNVGKKWRGAYETPGIHYITCNADEGEPGTFKDRVLLNSYADEVFEGMTLAGLICGAEMGYLYMRGEYEYLYDKLEAILQARRDAGVLGNNICGSGKNFDIEIHLGAGAYVCGEQSALLESVEGKRGIPRVRPPSAVKKGLFQQSTINNNVESFSQAAQVVFKGASWFNSIGDAKSRGTKLLSIAGDCARPGIYELPLGTSVREMLQLCGAEHTKAVQCGGPAGTCVGEAEFDRKISYADLATGGSIMIFNHSRDMLEVARQFSHFFAHESCGFCTPCRVGTKLLQHYADKIAQGHGTERDMQELQSLCNLVKNYSHCGLGETAPNPLLDTMKNFPQDYKIRLVPADFVPDFALNESVSESRALTGRTDQLHQSHTSVGVEE